MQRQPRNPHSPNTTITAAIRSRAFWSGIAAVLLCYFGFRAPWVVFSPTGWIIVYTLQGGGIAMAVCTVLLLTGWKTALAIDGIASMLIGAGLFASGLLMISGDTMQGLLSLVFGYMFVSSGWSGYCEWRWIAGRDEPVGESDSRYDPSFQSRYQQTLNQPPGESLASQLLDRSRNPQPQTDATHELADDDPMDLPDMNDHPEAEAPFEIEETTDEPRPPNPRDTPDGFLASFADPNPDNDRPS